MKAYQQVGNWLDGKVVVSLLYLLTAWEQVAKYLKGDPCVICMALRTSQGQACRMCGKNKSAYPPPVDP